MESGQKSFPKISIVTPSFNQGHYLEKTILSVIDQGYPNLEYIIIDGGSTDNSVEIIKRYEQHLAFWESVPDRGQSHAINKGFERATGDILAWLNSDDWYAPGALLAVADVFAVNPGAGAVVGAGEMVDTAGARLVHLDPFEVSVGGLYHWLDRFFWQPSCFFTRTAWETCGPLDENIHYAMDLDLWLKIAKRFPFASMPQLLSYNLKHSEAKTTEYGYRSIADVACVATEHGGADAVRNDLAAILKSLMESDRDNRNQIESLRSELAGSQHQCIEHEQRLAERDREVADLNHQIEACQAILSARETRIAALENSMSWKITRPIRWFADRAAGKK